MRQPRTLTRLRPARIALAALALALLPAAQLTPAQAAAACTHAGSVVTCTYGFTGAAETWVVPPGVTQAAFQVVGAPGGRSGGAAFGHAGGGRGADLRATLTLAQGTPVVITVGGPGGSDGNEAGGFNGGGGGRYLGNSYGLAGGGGGASDIRIGGNGLADRVLVAGGGGGGGSYGAGTGPGGSNGPAGGAGGDAGAAGAAGSTSAATGNATAGGGGGAGSASAGGQGGTAGQAFGTAGSSGALGQGGSVAEGNGNSAGGGGGGGVYGGGGGGTGGTAFSADESPGGGGGGGGASGSTTGFGIANVVLGVDTTRVPKVVITYTDATAPSVTVNQAVGQADPTDTNPLLFTAVFDEPVSGFTASGVALSGTADLSNAAVTVTGGPSSYTISVDGVAGNGTVIAAVLANAATDVAGNGNSASTSTDNSVTVTFISDSTPPEITPNVAGTLGNNGWYVGNIVVNWTVSDPESDYTTTDCAPQSVTADTPGVTFTCAATSAGGTSSQIVIVKRDATKPIVVSGTPDRAPNAAGWYNAPMTVSFAGSDATSGLAACTSPTYSGPDGAAVNVSGTCTDNAGNTSGPVSFGLNYDATAPVLSPSVTPNPAALNQPAAATPNATDATSGVASSSCSQPDTSSAGTKSVSCTAADVAGNTATANAGYSVVNEPPTIAVAPGGTCGDSSASGSIKLTVGDVNTGPNGLTLRLVSNSNTGLVPNSMVLFGGSGANRTMSVTAAAKKSGTAALTIGVSDGTSTSTLVVTVIVGTDKNETLNGTGGTDMIFGLLGANTINGLGGNDLLCGGNGVDTLNGGEGSDTLYGNRGDDKLTGNSGADFFSGGPGYDWATDFTPSQGDTKDGTVEKVTVLAVGMDERDSTAPEISSRLFLPTVQH